MRIVLLLFLFFSFLISNEKLIISKFENLKPYYYENQIVNLRLRTIVAEKGSVDIKDNLDMSTITTTKNGNEYITNISFKLEKKFPKFYITLSRGDEILDKYTLKIKSKIRHLYPPKNFCNVLASNIEIKDMVLSIYDDKYNIIYFTIFATNANAEDFSLGYKDEKLYLISQIDNVDVYSYSAIIPKNKYKFDFLYFNVREEMYKKISFTAKLKDERVSTQTDIKPLDTSHLILRDIIGVFFIILFFIIYLYRRRIIYLIFIFIVFGYLLYINVPKADVKLHKGEVIKLLPFKNSTNLAVVLVDESVKVLKDKDGWKKIEYKNQIGWVKDE